MSEYDLAKALNLPYNTINRIITGLTAAPRVSTLEQIAAYFGTSLDFFLGKNQENIHGADDNVPVLTWEFLAHPDFIKKIDRATWEKSIPAAQLLNNVESIDKVFAIESTKSMQPRFPNGTTFIVKFGESPKDGDLVLIRFKSDNSISLRELIIDSPNWQLNPIVLGSQPILFNHLDHAIIGVVVLTLIQTRAS